MLVIYDSLSHNHGIFITNRIPINVVLREVNMVDKEQCFIYFSDLQNGVLFLILS